MENWLEILQLGEIGGLGVLICVVLFYSMWGYKNVETRGFYRKVMIVSAVIYLICAYFLRIK